MNTMIDDIRPHELTVKMLDAMKPHTIFAHGYMEHIHPWFNNLTKIRSLGHAHLEVEGTGDPDASLQVPNSKYRLVKWVAIRGTINDWAIYHSIDANLCQEDYFDCDCHLLSTWYQIAEHGAKLHNMDEVKRWVPCTEEALALYRH